uniref:Uncharacterized protein n=1 Tax=Candidatus Kentrum sp. MB TaxID=2138164 RepID=A0A450XZ73_9GAMM|nr:MAG: hypothetical protein BECKMB1821G_GA0114241_11043 [Candidatus Kentron sp. MB]VFK34599.1 MAG: hypothetical protein BECKMB1821I_GA0114274_107711 [Candidatus Kentron sp. MB]VFK76862.1 MAG: hypothetical protein BECKMB1821H_GA0114242_107913 [Candidatus Kentron sp. MB]
MKSRGNFRHIALTKLRFGLMKHDLALVKRNRRFVKLICEAEWEINKISMREIVQVKRSGSLRPDGGGSVIRGIFVVNGERTGGS